MSVWCLQLRGQARRILAYRVGRLVARGLGVQKDLLGAGFKH